MNVDLRMSVNTCFVCVCVCVCVCVNSEVDISFQTQYYPDFRCTSDKTACMNFLNLPGMSLPKTQAREAQPHREKEREREREREREKETKRERETVRQRERKRQRDR